MPEKLPDVTPTDGTGALQAYAALYPEVVEAGSVRDALRAAADRAGHGLTVEPVHAPGRHHTAARVDSADRTAHVLMLGGSERGFAVDCWTGGVCAATGSTPDLAEAAGAMHSWTQGAELRELTAGWTFLRTLDLAEAEERRETETIARRWHFRVQRQASRRDADWRDLAVAAHAQPRLRALSPGRAMYWFTLSRRATPPTCDDLPRTRPLGRHRFEVTYADGRVQVVKGAEAAVAAILEGLPEDITAAAPDA